MRGGFVRCKCAPIAGAARTRARSRTADNALGAGLREEADGAYKLNGVEFLVPISAWTAADPPRIMGQALKKADRLGIWYLHVWTWEPSPSGLFADWNPNVKCGGVSSKHH